MLNVRNRLHSSNPSMPEIVLPLLGCPDALFVSFHVAALGSMVVVTSSLRSVRFGFQAMLAVSSYCCPLEMQHVDGHLWLRPVLHVTLEKGAVAVDRDRQT